MAARRGVAWSLVGALLSLQCGGSSNTSSVDRTGGDGHLGDPDASLPTGGTGGDGGKTSPEPDAGQGEGGGSSYVDPECPDAVRREGFKQCDPFADDSGCPFDLACFPYVDYPDGPCEVEVFGTECAPAGTGRQGDSCIDEDCSGGFICVVTGRGTQCVRMCSIDVAAQCDPGFLCQPLDIDGVGGCFPP